MDALSANMASLSVSVDRLSGHMDAFNRHMDAFDAKMKTFLQDMRAFALRMKSAFPGDWATRPDHSERLTLREADLQNPTGVLPVDFARTCSISGKACLAAGAETGVGAITLPVDIGTAYSVTPPTAPQPGSAGGGNAAPPPPPTRLGAPDPDEERFNDARFGENSVDYVLPVFPKALSGGPANVHVYMGVRGGKPVYSGITNNIGRRSVQHGDRFDQLDQLTNAAVTRGQARAIEPGSTA